MARHHTPRLTKAAKTLASPRSTKIAKTKAAEVLKKHQEAAH